MNDTATPTPLEPRPQDWVEDSKSWAGDIGKQPAEPPATRGAGTGGAASPAAPAASAAPEGAPPVLGTQEYDFDLDVPEGMGTDPQLMEEFRSLAVGSGIAKDTAQKLLDLEVKNVQRQVEAFTRQQEAWRGEIARDPEFGGEKLDSTVRSARKALAAYDPEGTLLPELDKTGYGNHPGIIRFLARVGRSLAEDTAYVARHTPPADQRPLRDRLWPD